MNDPYNTPTFNMKVVVRETGLKPDTLRAWERRYGVPSPQRTSGGHRLYSQFQIDMLKWMIARQEEGMAISHVIDLWQQLIASGDDPFLMDAEEAESPSGLPFALSGERIADLRTAWLNACLIFDEHEAQYFLAQAFAQFPAETVCHEILQKNLNRIGQMWYEGKATVQQEHFCSSLAIRQMETLLANVSRPSLSVKLVIACGPEEQHTFSALFLAYLCRRRGWDVVYLGANVPKARMETVFNPVSVDLVLLSAQTLHTAGAMMSMAQLLNELKVPMAYGGAVFVYLEEARRYVPGHYLGDNLLEAPDRIAHLLHHTNSVEVESIPEACQTAVSNFCRIRSAIEARVENELVNDIEVSYQVRNANNDLGNNIIAALQLGNINLLTANINWLKGLLVYHHDLMPGSEIGTYIKSYHLAVEALLDSKQGKPILDWFKQIRKSIDVDERVRVSR